MLEGFSGGLIVALVDFFVVFLVLGGLAAAIQGFKKLVEHWERKTTVSTTQPEPISRQEAIVSAEKDRTTPTHIAAILAALQEFTGLPAGSFKVDAITPCETMPAEFLNGAQVAAVSAALHEYASLPAGSFRMNGMTRFGSVSPWKMAGRMELMNMESRMK